MLESCRNLVFFVTLRQVLLKEIDMKENIVGREAEIEKLESYIRAVDPSL